MIFLKDFFEKVDFEINQHHGKFSGGKELILLAVFCLPKIKVSSFGQVQIRCDILVKKNTVYCIHVLKSNYQVIM